MPELDAALARIATEVVAEFRSAGLTPEGLSISAIDLAGRPAGSPLAMGSYRGDVAYYPASVVKAFYLVYYESEKEARRLKDTPEIVRAVHDMNKGVRTIPGVIPRVYQKVASLLAAAPAVR